MVAPDDPTGAGQVIVTIRNDMNNKLNLALALLVCSAVTGGASDRATSFAGITEPILNATMSSPVPGIVGARPVKEGDFIKQGSVVIELDKKLEELEVDRRKAALDPLKADLEATQALFKKNSISTVKVELAKKEGDYNVALAEIELAKEQLRKRQIVAPFSGYIAELFREVGESCQANERLVQIVDTRRCYFVSNIDAKAGYRLKVGQTIRLEIEAGDTPVNFDGKVSFISPVVDPASGLLKIKVIFDNPEGKIRPGVAGKMRLEGV
jgi:RND family efflux transporter MFP subunit